MKPQLHNAARLVPSWRLIAAHGDGGVRRLAGAGAVATRHIDVDGQRWSPTSRPVTAGGVAYLPLRAVADAAGAVTTFDARTGTIVVRHNGVALRIKMGARQAVLDGRPVTLTHAPFTVQGRAMVRGYRYRAGARLGGSSYDSQRGRIDVRTPGGVVAGVPDDDSP